MGLAIFSSLALANEPGKTETDIDYNTFGIDYQYATLGSKTYTGYEINGGFLISNNVFTNLSYGSLTRTGDSSFETTSLGLGYRLPIGQNADAFASISYLSITNDSTTNGYSATLGVKAKVASQTELSGQYTYSSVDSSSFNTFGVGVKYNISDQIYISGKYQNYTGEISGSNYLIGSGFKF